MNEIITPPLKVFKKRRAIVVRANKYKVNKGEKPEIMLLIRNRTKISDRQIDLIERLLNGDIPKDILKFRGR